MTTKPDILIILAEDICPNLGCYGDQNAKTPNLDAFAKENIRFDYCYSAAPVCSAARTSLNLGINGPSAGVGNHRSCYALPAHIKNFGDYMQREGYYTMIGKTDLNFPLTSGYDEIIPFTRDDTPAFATRMMEHIRAAQDKPVFILQTSAITHQSQYGYTQNRQEHRATMPRLTLEEHQTREQMVIPGYHFKSAEADEIWAQYHEKMTAMDKMFGELIDALKANGRYDDTVILFAGDNGHGIPAGKSNLWNEGVHVPLLAHFPQALAQQLDVRQEANGKVCDRLVSFVDFLPTALSIAGGEIPAHLEGRPLVGDQRVAAPEDVYCFGMRVDEAFENSRCIHEKDLMYACDFGLTPYRRLNVYQTTQAPWFVRSMICEGRKHQISDVDRRALFRQIPRVTEQLFDLQQDVFSLNNCAQARADDTRRMREKMHQYIETTHDAVWIPEPLITEIMGKTDMLAYDILHDTQYYPIAALRTLWDAYLNGDILPTHAASACEKIWLTKFWNDAGECFDRYLNDESEVVCAYTAYRIGDYTKLAELAAQTQNYMLLVFIIDCISNTRDKSFESVYQIIIHRDFDSFAIDPRFTRGMEVGTDMLSLRIASAPAENMMEHEFWVTDKHIKARMVLDELDLT